MSKRWVQNAAIAAGCVLLIFGMIYWDVVSRAKESFQTGEQYMYWHDNPDEKKAHFQKKFEQEKTELDEMLRTNKLTEAEYREKLDIIEFDRDFHIRESSLKYAYQWYKDTYELFSPPESKWVRRAREKAPQVLAMWKKELDAKKIPYEDYMLE